MKYELESVKQSVATRGSKRQFKTHLCTQHYLSYTIEAGAYRRSKHSTREGTSCLHVLLALQLRDNSKALHLLTSNSKPSSRSPTWTSRARQSTLLDLKWLDIVPMPTTKTLSHHTTRTGYWCLHCKMSDATAG